MSRFVINSAVLPPPPSAIERLLPALGLPPRLPHETDVTSPLFRVALQRRLRVPVWDRDSACGMCNKVLSITRSGTSFVQRWPNTRQSLPNWRNLDFCCPRAGGTGSELDHGLDPSLGGRRTADVWVPRAVSGFAKQDISPSSPCCVLPVSPQVPPRSPACSEGNSGCNLCLELWHK